jgi:aspartate dehydrogenase
MKEQVRVAIGSLGTVGLAVAQRLASGEAGLVLSAVSARDQTRARERLAGLGLDVPVVALGALAEHADAIVECAPAEHFLELAGPVVEAGKTLVPISVAGLLEHMGLVDRARATGARILVPSGAILGLDALRAAAEGEIHEVRMVTRKPPGGLAGAPHLARHGISVEGLSEPLKVFEGSAAEGARGFPANVNVAAAVGLAGVGAERTVLEIWADPGIGRNVHDIHVSADAASFSLHIENVPTQENPRTGRLVAQSVMATLRRLSSPLIVGT